MKKHAKTILNFLILYKWQILLAVYMGVGLNLLAVFSIFDPELRTLWETDPAGNGFDRYWTFKETWEGSIRWGFLFLLWLRVPYQRVFLKVVLSGGMFLIVLNTLDLWITGNWLWDSWGAIWWDSILTGAGIIYAVVAWFLWWRTKKSDPIEPGKVYLITRPPRSLLEWIGTVLRPGEFGPVAFIETGKTGVIWYGVEIETGLYKSIGHNSFNLRPNQVAKLMDIDRLNFYPKFMKTVYGQKWTPLKNCWWMKRQILK